MCGIIGYIGEQKAAPIILEGLKKLEYRGYDSAGVALLDSEKISVTKTTGRVAELEKKLKKDSGSIGIGHTRWATHGGVTEENAHPHWGETSRITLIHNGIIENYRELKEFLTEKGHTFRSETDTEVLAHLIDYYFKKTSRHSGLDPESIQIDSGSPIKSGMTQESSLEVAVAKALQKARGAYAVVVMSEDDPDKIVVGRLSSPLVLGVGENEMLIASDVSALVKHTKKVVYLDDGEMAVVRQQDYAIYKIEEVLKKNSQELDKEVSEIDWDIEEAQKGGYEHFMLKEIMEESQAVADSLRGRIDFDKNTVRLGGVEEIKSQLKDIKRIVITACGTASYAGLLGTYILEDIAGIPTEMHTASEFRSRDSILEKGTAVLAISQSGETIDTLEAIRKAKSAGVLTLGIVNVVGSTIARETDAGIYNHVGPEIAVASTKAYVSQVTVLILLALYIAQLHERDIDYDVILPAIQKLPSQIQSVLDRHKEFEDIASHYAGFQNMFFLGRKYNVSTALEGSIKLKEVSYLHSEAYPAGEMKHGPIALLDKDFPTIVVAPRDSVYEKTVSAIQEARARDSRILAVVTEGDKQIREIAHDVIEIPKTHELLYPILAVVPLHLFAYYIAVRLGNDVDKPRNLAKSVTVE